MIKSRTGRVQTPELDLRQAIQPQGLPGSTYVQPPAAPRDNSLLQIADALGSVSGGLARWASKQRQEAERAKAEHMDEAKVSAEAARYNMDPASYLEMVKKQPDEDRRIWEAQAGFNDAADYEKALGEWYKTSFDHEKGDIYADAEAFRRKYIADHGITDPHRIAVFGKATDQMHGGLITDQQNYLSKKVEADRLNAATTNYDLVVQSVVRDKSDPKQISRLLGALGKEWKDDKLGKLTPEQNDQALKNLAEKYAAAGNVEVAEAILRTPRGGRGSLFDDPETAAVARDTLIKAHGNAREIALNNDPYEKAKIKLRAFAGIAEDDEIRNSRFHSDAEKAELFAVRDVKRQEKLEDDQKKLDLAEFQKQYDVGVKTALVDARNAVLDPNSGFSGAYFTPRVRLKRDDPTKTESYSIKEQKDDLIAFHEKETADRLKQELAVAGTDLAKQQEAYAHANATHLQFYGAMREPRQQWEADMNAAAASVPAILAGKGKVPPAVQRAYAIYTSLMTQNAPLASMMLKDDNTRLLFETFNAVNRDGNDDDESAWITAAERVRLKVENKLPHFNASAKDIVAQMGGGIFSGDIPTNGVMINEIRSQAEILFQTGYMSEKDAIAKAAERVRQNYTDVNGSLVKELPPDYGPLAEKQLAHLVEMYGTNRQIGKDGKVTSTRLVDDEDELILNPIAGTNNQWNVMIKAEGRNLLDDQGKPVVVTLDDLEIMRESEELDARASVTGKDSDNVLWSTQNFMGQGIPFVLGGFWETQKQHENALKELIRERSTLSREGEPAHWLTKKNNTLMYDSTGVAPKGFNASGLSGPDDVKFSTLLLMKHEGFAPIAGWDETAFRGGYGSDTFTKEDGSFIPVTKGMTFTKADAARDLARRIPEFQKTVKGQIGAQWDDMNDIQKAVLVNVAYNYGSLPKRLVNALATGDTKEVSLTLLRLGNDNKGRRKARYRELAALYRGAIGKIFGSSMEFK